MNSKEILSSAAADRMISGFFSDYDGFLLLLLNSLYYYIYPFVNIYACFAGMP